MPRLPAYPPIPADKFDAPVPPFSSKELWTRIRALLLAYEGDVKPCDVQQVFGIPLIRGYYSDGSGQYYDRSGQSDEWYESINIQYGSETGEVRFNIGWKNSSFDSNYLTKNMVKKDLNGSKWTLVGQFRHHGTARDIYAYKQYSLYVELNGDLVTGITVGQILPKR